MCPAISLTIYGYNLLCERSRSFANNSLNAREGNYAGIFKIRTQRPNRPGTNRGFFYSIYFFVCWIESTGVISIERKGLRAGYHASKITDFISLFLKKYPSQPKKSQEINKQPKKKKKKKRRVNIKPLSSSTREISYDTTSDFCFVSMSEKNPMTSNARSQNALLFLVVGFPLQNRR